MTEYTNPVISGFYPDPSICRAYGKYYLVCSSMHYFPGVPLFESEDLINWQQIGWCLTRKSQVNLVGVPSSGGIFAPTIRFWNGRFYMVTTDDSRHRNFYVYTDDIYKEWSEPIEVKQGGIDPSLYFEGEKVYFTSNGRDENNQPCIFQCEIDINSGDMLSESRKIWMGSGGRLVEGPHLYKIDEYYYLLAAEGGTEYGHMVTIAKADNPYGPFESYSHNPILTNRDMGDSELQGLGHGDLIEDWQGDWWIVCLGFRQMALWQQYHHLGREVFLLPVTFNEEGWPIVNKKGIAENPVRISSLSIEQRKERTDDFETEGWNMKWSHLRECRQEDYCIEKGVLKLKGMKCSLDEPNAPTFIGLRQNALEGELSVEIAAEEGETGVSIFMDEQHHYDVAVCCGKDIEYVIRICIGGIKEEIKVRGESKDVTIKVCAQRERYALSIVSPQGVRVEKEMASKYLSSEVAGGFTGVLFGLYAINKSESDAWNTFSKFTWKGR